MLRNPTGLDLAAIVDPNIRRAVTVSDLVTFTNSTTHGIRFNDNVRCQFGTTPTGFMYSDGTSIILDPGSTGNIFRIGAATTDKRNLYTYRIGLGDTAASSGALCQFTTTDSTIAGVFSGTFTHTGAVNTLRTLLFTCVHAGTTTGAQTSVGGVFTANSNSDTSTGTRTCLGIQGSGGFSAGQVMTQGTHDYQGIVAKAGTVGGTHTGGNIRSRNLIIEEEPTYVGGTVIVNVAAQCQGTFHLLQNRKFIVSGTALAPGTSYFIYNNSTTDWEFFDAGTSVLKLDASGNTLMVHTNVTDATNFILGTTTGTKIGTATTQKLGFWNATPITQPASANQAAVATTAATNITPFGYTTQAQADAIITLLNEIRTVLVNEGLMKGAA